MGSGTALEYVQILVNLTNYKDIPEDVISPLWRYTNSIFRSDQQEKYSEPMPWIGIYIALASLICMCVMVADLVHGLKNRKLWFPCKYFTLNAASLSVIAVAIKLPMDLNNSMPGAADQSAKLGSMAFMCIMMANTLPSLASMDNKELVTNIIALGMLVITLLVNVCIQIKTGVVSYTEDKIWEKQLLDNISFNVTSTYTKPYTNRNKDIAIIYVVMILVLMLIHICSALAILKSKDVLESKYQVGHEIALKNQEEQQGRLNVEKLKQHVSNYWIMAETGNPQFMIVCSATTSASGVISALSILLLMIIISSNFIYDLVNEHGSDYKWSIPVIFITQTIGAILGTIAPLSRCFASLSFKVSIKKICEQVKVFKVERYWTHKLYGWRRRSIPFQFHSRKCQVFIENSKNLILNFFIGFQKTVVVACKMTALIPVFLMVCVLCCLYCWKGLKVMFSACGFVLVNKPEKLNQKEDLRQYVLQIQDDMEPAERTLNGMLKSMNILIQKAEKKQPKNLMKLLEKSKGFEGVEIFDSYNVPLLSKQYHNCWSLPLVTLTAIAISLPNIQTDIVESLVRSVSEGLVYVTLVEETLNATDEYVSSQKASKMLWLEVYVHQKWLGNKLKESICKLNTTRQILELLRDTARNMVTEVEGMNIENSDENSIYTSICANPMYRITQSILFYYQNTIDQVSQDELFGKLSSIISDILAACLTNLPQVTAMRCHTSVIEQREASVHAAAKLLGETTHIINSFQDRELPGLSQDEFPLIDMWRMSLKHKRFTSINENQDILTIVCGTSS